MDGLVQRVITTGGQPADLTGGTAGPAAPGGSPTRANKNMTGSVTAADGQVATATAVASTPVYSTDPNAGYIGVAVNGIWYVPGDGTKVAVPCYFSSDGGVTARALRNVAAGDLLYWNGSVAGFQIAATDRIGFYYNV